MTTRFATALTLATLATLTLASAPASAATHVATFQAGGNCLPYTMNTPIDQTSGAVHNYGTSNISVICSIPSWPSSTAPNRIQYVKIYLYDNAYNARVEYQLCFRNIYSSAVSCGSTAYSYWNSLGYDWDYLYPPSGDYSSGNWVPFIWARLPGRTGLTGYKVYRK